MRRKTYVQLTNIQNVSCCTPETFMVIIHQKKISKCFYIKMFRIYSIVDLVHSSRTWLLRFKIKAIHGLHFHQKDGNFYGLTVVGTSFETIIYYFSENGRHVIVLYQLIYGSIFGFLIFVIKNLCILMYYFQQCDLYYFQTTLCIIILSIIYISYMNFGNFLKEGLHFPNLHKCTMWTGSQLHYWGSKFPSPH